MIKLKIYIHKKAGVVNGKLDKKTSIVLKKKVTMTEDYAKALNQGYKNSGVYYELDKEATKEFEKAKKAKEK